MKIEKKIKKLEKYRVPKFTFNFLSFVRNELEIGKVLYELSGRAVLHFFPLNDYDVQKRDMSPGVGGAKHRNKRTNIPSK